MSILEKIDNYQGVIDKIVPVKGSVYKEIVKKINQELEKIIGKG